MRLFFSFTFSFIFHFFCFTFCDLYLSIFVIRDSFLHCNLQSDFPYSWFVIRDSFLYCNLQSGFRYSWFVIRDSFPNSSCAMLFSDSIFDIRFLVADMQLYESFCPSLGWSVRPYSLFIFLCQNVLIFSSQNEPDPFCMDICSPILFFPDCPFFHNFCITRMS